MSQKNNTPTVLLIGGSDSGGGAGIQADLRVLTAYRLAGACAITAATAQNPSSVCSLNLLSPARVASQIDAVMLDLSVAAIKIGMLGNLAIARVVRERLRHCKVPIVLDPVMIATSGGSLLDQRGIEFLRKQMLPISTIVTPNLPEAELLIGRPIGPLSSREQACRALIELGAQGALIKGGHARGATLTDVYVDASAVRELNAVRMKMRTHGTGCTFASAIAAELALGQSPVRAVDRAHEYLQSALKAPLKLGRSETFSPGFGSPPK